jgi:two-component system, sporulation sensor kinase C
VRDVWASPPRVERYRAPASAFHPGFLGHPGRPIWPSVIAVPLHKKQSSSKRNAADPPSVAAIVLGDERWFRAVADYTIDWESWHGPDGRLLWVNPAVERVTGYSVAECLAMLDYPLPIVVHEDRTRIENVLRAARDRKAGDNVDFRSMSPKGESRWMSLSWQPMYGACGSYLGFRTSVRDVTERRLLREQLRLHAEHLEQLVQERTQRLRQLEQRQRQMDKLVSLGQLAAGVAHEINNPLAGMRNAFELIKSSLPPEHEHYELLGLVDKEFERIGAITHQMYQLYKRAHQKPHAFTITRTVHEVIQMLAHTAASRNIRLNFGSSDKMLQVILFEGEVKQILYNLLCNAIQASPPGSEVSVGISQHAEGIVVSVEDRGPGIPDDILPRIFDPFFSTKQGYTEGGMGLGLSVSHSLAEAMGGRIEVISTPGKGSRFSAVFPLRFDLPAEAADG